MRPTLKQWLLAGLLSTISLAVTAEPMAYGVGYRELYRIDLANGQATRIDRNFVGYNDIEGLAISPDGTLYGAADDAAGAGSGLTDFLIRIDTSSGEGRLVAPLPGLAGMGPGGQLNYGLAFTTDGRLWLSSETTGELWEVNPSSATVRRVGATGKAISGLAARGTQLFGVTAGAVPELVRIDRDSAAATSVGLLNAGVVVHDVGLDFDATGALWATLDPEPAEIAPTRVARVDLDTGRATVVSTVATNVGIEGLAIGPPPAVTTGGGVAGLIAQQIPASSTWALLILITMLVGCAALVLRSR